MIEKIIDKILVDKFISGLENIIIEDHKFISKKSSVIFDDLNPSINIC